jgi:hypothetical protein
MRQRSIGYFKVKKERELHGTYHSYSKAVITIKTNTYFFVFLFFQEYNLGGAISGRRPPDSSRPHATVSIGIRPSHEAKGRWRFFFKDCFERRAVVVRLLRSFVAAAKCQGRWRPTANEKIRTIK